jgi:hypothetical protein
MLTSSVSRACLALSRHSPSATSSRGSARAAAARDPARAESEAPSRREATLSGRRAVTTTPLSQTQHANALLPLLVELLLLLLLPFPALLLPLLLCCCSRAAAAAAAAAAGGGGRGRHASDLAAVPCRCCGCSARRDERRSRCKRGCESATRWKRGAAGYHSRLGQPGATAARQRGCQPPRRATAAGCVLPRAAAPRQDRTRSEGPRRLRRPFFITARAGGSGGWCA